MGNGFDFSLGVKRGDEGSSLHKEDRDFIYSSSQFSLNTTIIKDVLGCVNAMGGALKVAQKVIENLGSQLSVAHESSQSSKKIAHLLFVVENLMGIPIINVLLLYMNSIETKNVIKSNCHASIKTTIDFKYHQEDYMFVDPSYIEQFTSEFVEHQDYNKLVDQLAGYIS